MERYAVIMAGGVGSRFWPSSTESRPKQFLDITGSGRSLLRMTYERCLPLIDKENILILTNKAYKSLVAEELTELPVNNILCEPSRNNTAPCVAYAALHIESRNPDSSFAVLSSDHMIAEEVKFLFELKKALEFVEHDDRLLSLSITPSRPDTGYGYIELGNEADDGIYNVIKFVEKPNYDKAKEYIDSGKYVWNAGIFVWKTSSIINAFKKYAPQIIDTLSQEKSMFNTDQEDAYLERVYPLTENISIDFAIMERAKNVYTLPSEFGWSDLGTWASLYDFSDKNEQSNVVISKTSVIRDVKNCLIKVKENKKLLIRGLENFIVVDEDDALLIYPIDKEQDIKKELEKFQ